MIAGAGVAQTDSASAATLELRGPERCSDREQLAFEVARRLGSSIEQVPSRLGFDVHVSRTAGGYAGRLRVEDAERPGAPSERQLAESNCEQLISALAVVIVLAIHRAESATEATPAVLSPVSREPEPITPLEPAPDDRPMADDGTRSTEADESALHAGAAAWLGVDVGALPDPSPGLGLSVELTRRRLRLSTSVLFFPEQHAALPSELSPTPGAEIALALGALAGCYAPGAPWDGELMLGACVRGEVGRLYGRGTNVRAARSEARWWIAPGLDLLGSWKAFPALRLNAQAGVTAPLLRTEFRLGELGGLYRPAALTYRAAVGVGVTFD